MIQAGLVEQQALTSLRRRGVLFTVSCILVLLLGYVFLVTFWHQTYALRWVLLTGLVLVYQTRLLWISFPTNRRLNDQVLLPDLGWGNVATLVRGVMFAALTGFVFSPRPPGALVWIPALLYTVGSLIDYVDGYLARISNRVTRLGEMLDMSMDGWGFLIATYLAVRYGQTQGWYLIMGMARYLFLVGMWVRTKLKLPNHELLPSVTRRPFAGLQMGFAFVVLWPVFTPPGTFHAAAIFSIPSLAGFFRDWLVVCGVLGAEFGHRLEGLKDFAVNYLPIFLRIAVLVVMALVVFPGMLSYPSQMGYPAAQGAVWSNVLAVILIVLEAVTWAGIGLGAAGRISAILGMLALGIHQMFMPLVPIQLALLWLYGGVLYLGTGRLSLWKPENRLIYFRAGEKRT